MRRTATRRHGRGMPAGTAGATVRFPTAIPILKFPRLFRSRISRRLWGASLWDLSEWKEKSLGIFDVRYT